MFESAYTNLNKNQKEAVDTIFGPVLVVAGPGTGKTQILSVRIANILRQTDASPENILALTFTENAALNMQERLKKFVGTDSYRVNIATFHGFCNEIISTFPEKFAFKNELKQIDDLKKFNILQNILTSFSVENAYRDFDNYLEIVNAKPSSALRPFGAPFLYIHDILSAIDFFKREFVTEVDIRDGIKNEIEKFADIEKLSKRTGKLSKKWIDTQKLIAKNIELLAIFSQYNQILRSESLYDFGDMIALVTQKLKTDEELLAYYQELYQFILVDEYQDTNGAQNEILKTLGSWDSNPNIFVVGDDDQAIFKFQGANVSNILDFQTTYPDCKIIVLDTNYRSYQPILDLSQNAINPNTQRLIHKIPNLTKNLKSHTDQGVEKVDIKLTKYTKGEIEYTDIAAQIDELIKTDTPAEEIAIIYTKHREGETIAKYLSSRGIDLNIAKSKNLLTEPMFAKIRILLNTIADPTNNENLAKTLLLDLFEINAKNIFELLGHFSRNKNSNLIDLILDIVFLNEQLNLTDSMQIYSLANKLLEWQKLESNSSLDVFFMTLINDIAIIDRIKKSKNLADLQSIKTLNDFLNTRVREHHDYNLTNFLADIQALETNNLSIQIHPLTTQTKGVNMLTAHASKGLEFEYVFIPKIIDKTWGNTRNISKLKLLNFKNSDIADLDEKQARLEEERRLFFVALTRAKSGLHLSYSDQYLNDTGEYKPSRESVFLEDTEIPAVEYTKTPDTFDILSAELTKPQIDIFVPEHSDFLKSQIKNFKLSASSLNTYLTNPEEFLYRYILKIPASTNKHLALGTAIHTTLEYFFRLVQKDKMEGLEYFLDIYKNTLQKDFGYHKDFEITLLEGQKLFENWYHAHKTNPVKPIALEYSFYGHKVVLDDIALVGKIDKVEWLDREANKVKVIDYKTSAPKTASSIHKPLNGGEESNIYRQLVFYKLMTQLDRGFRYTVDACEIQFVKPENDVFKKATFVVSDDEVEEMKGIIRESMRKIRALDF